MVNFSNLTPMMTPKFHILYKLSLFLTTILVFSKFYLKIVAIGNCIRKRFIRYFQHIRQNKHVTYYVIFYRIKMEIAWTADIQFF